MQLLLQLADGYTSLDAKRLATQLHADGAVISSSLPQDTWLVLAPDTLKAEVYRPHSLLPYSPEYKLAPEWHSVLELVHQENQDHHSKSLSTAMARTQHMQLHKHILEHETIQKLQLVEPAEHLRHAAAAAAAAAGEPSNNAVARELAAAAPAKILVGVQFPEVPVSALQRLGVQKGDFHPAQAAAQDWQQPLATLVQQRDRSQDHLALCSPELLANSPWELNVAVCPQDLAEVLYWLSNQASVHWLAPRPRLYYQNTVASTIVQSSTMKTALDYQTPDAHVFWSAGLDGKNQILGMGDSGVDMDSCFFSDPQVPFSPPTGSLEWYNERHRKVIYYWGLADESFRDLVGHGTHTAGSMLGFSPQAPDSKAIGAARSARLAFADLSRTAGGDVNAPQDLEQNYFPKLRATGACVFSDSWGSTSPIYDFQASKLDSWLYNNQDCISHFAAGNYGENDNLDSTITSPATAKNVMTVGATKTFAQNYISQTIAPVFALSVEIKRANKPSQYVGVRLVKADFGGDGASLSGKGLRVVRAVPDVACGSLEGSSTGAYTNAIVLARRGTCVFSQKMAAGAAAGAAAVVVINDKPGGYFKMDAQDAGASSAIALFAITKRMGEQLWSFFDNADSLAATIERYAQGWPAYEDIASFSSFGPTNDGRIKPDIVGPGDLVSASSADNDPAAANTAHCNTGRKSGTSMATPMVAGHAAIIRQYFMDGFYPTGVFGNQPHVPSGPLLKAIMMGGACDMQGNTEQYLPLEDSPSMRQGFGRLCLCNSLKLGDKCTTNVQLVDRVPITSAASHKYCLHTTGGDVRITLAWYDYPASPSAAKALVNDLDLTVVSAGMGGQAFFGNMNLQKDSLNTVERVWLRNVPPGALEVIVTTGQLSHFTPSQNYSLVVQGAFAGTLNSTYNPDPTAGRISDGCPAAWMASSAATAAATATPAAAPPAVVALSPPLERLASSVIEEKGQAAVAGNTSTVVPAAAGAAPAAAAAQPAVPAAASTAAPVAPTADAPAANTAPVPAIEALPVPPPASTAPAAASIEVAAATSSDKASLVNALVGAMQASAPATAAAVTPEAAALQAVAPATSDASAAVTVPAQGRRLTWMPTAPSLPSWMSDPNTSVAIRVPALMCRWLNASSYKAPAAASGPASSSSSSRNQPGAPGSRIVLVPVPAVALVIVATLATIICVALFGLRVRRYSITRSASLTSAVCQAYLLSLNKRQGEADHLGRPLLTEGSFAEQRSPRKLAALGLQRSGTMASRSASVPNSAAGSPTSSNSSGLSPSGSSFSDPGTPTGLGAFALTANDLPLRVRLATHSETMGLRTGTMTPPTSPLLTPSSSAPAAAAATGPQGQCQVRSSRAVSVAVPDSNGMTAGSASSPSVGVLPPRPLHVLVGCAAGAEGGEAMVGAASIHLSAPNAATSPFGAAAAQSGFHRCSLSFTFGQPVAATATAQEGMWPSGPDASPAPDAQGFEQQQADDRNKGWNQQANLLAAALQQDGHVAVPMLAAHQRALSAPGYADAGLQRDQQRH